MANKILNFSLDSKDLKVKELLKGDFLELEVKAISNANPNRNGSYFTLESMKDALETFVNKPILGNFDVKQGDFKAHESKLEYDPELDGMYFDYTAQDTEKILGMIRESDPVEIKEDSKTGLSWICFNSVIWTNYNYKAVKSLLKSRNGHSSVSVEIEVLDSEVDENDIEVIKKFNFLGCTILGSKVDPGIAEASLSVLNFMNNANYDKKQKCLAFAYEALDKYVETPQTFGDSNIINEDPAEEITMAGGSEEGGAEMTEEKKEVCECPCGAEEPVKEEEACGGKVTEAEACPCGEEEPKKEEEACGDKATEACGDKKEVEACGEKTFEEEEHHPIDPKNVIHKLLIDEHEATEGYNKALGFFKGDEKICAVLTGIMHDELEHIGNLEFVLNLLDPETEEELQEGKDEAVMDIAKAMVEPSEEPKPEAFEEEKPEEDGKGPHGPHGDDDDHDDDKDDDHDDPDDKDDDHDDPDDKDDDHDDDKDDPDDHDEKYIVIGDKQFTLETLSEEYSALKAEYESVMAAKKVAEAEKLAKFGENLISAEEEVNKDSKKEFVEELSAKCMNFEFSTEEQVRDFVENKLAMYFYKHRAEKKNTGSNFSMNLDITRSENTASKNSLKEAIYKLNHSEN